MRLRNSNFLDIAPSTQGFPESHATEEGTDALNNVVQLPLGIQNPLHQREADVTLNDLKKILMEFASRQRRIETRLVKLMAAQGINTQGEPL
jgi:hypothetical protein